MNYLKYLSKQFCESTGIPLYAYNSSDEFIKDLFSWIKIRNNIMKDVSLYLNDEIMNDDVNVFEIDKGKYDTFFSELNIHIISRYIKEQDFDNLPIVLNAEFNIVEEKPFIKLPNKSILSLDDVYMEHVFTTNPYNMKSLAGWESIFNKGLFYATIGVYGSLCDLDMNSKIEGLKKFKECLLYGYNEVLETFNGEYFYFLTNVNNNNNPKQKILM